MAVYAVDHLELAHPGAGRARRRFGSPAPRPPRAAAWLQTPSKLFGFQRATTTPFHPSLSRRGGGCFRERLLCQYISRCALQRGPERVDDAGYCDFGVVTQPVRVDGDRFTLEQRCLI